MSWEKDAKSLFLQLQGLKKTIEPMTKAELSAIWADLCAIPKNTSKEKLKAHVTSSLQKIKMLLKNIEGEIKAALNSKPLKGAKKSPAKKSSTKKSASQKFSTKKYYNAKSSVKKSSRRPSLAKKSTIKKTAIKKLKSRSLTSNTEDKSSSSLN
jgi:hypothetical protein